MGFKEFAEKVRREMEAILGRKTGVSERTKRNGIKVHGLVVEGEAGAPMPFLHLEPFYRAYLEGAGWEGVMGEILSAYEMFTPGGINMGWLKDYGKVKGRVVYKLLNYESNQEILADMVYERYLDLAKACYVSCSIGGEAASMPVNKAHLSMWGVTEKEARAEAEKNTPILMPVKYGRLQDMLRQAFEGMMTEGEKEGGYLEIWGEKVRLDEMADPIPGMYVLTNQGMLHGAAAMCYPGVLKGIAEEAGSDLVVLPSSVHEAIVLPAHAGMGRAEELREMVYTINRTEVPWEDVLSDNAYIYRKDKDRMEIM